MNFYQQQVQVLTQRLYPKVYLVKHVINSKKFIDSNYSSDISLDDMAAAAFMSKFHFVRLFKKYYGKTPYQYLTEVRIIKAKALLKAGHSVSETCYQLGFNSLSSFSILFKKMGGLSPSDFATKAISNK